LGHVNFGVISGPTAGSIYGGNGISGIGSDTATINLPGTSNTSFTTSGQTENYQQGTPPATKYAATGGSISNINVNGNIGEDFTIKSAWNVGNISAQSFEGDGPTITALGAIGNITATSASGVINGTFDAGKGIGNLTATGEIDGTYTARGSANIGNITSSWGIGVNDDMTVNANKIGNITSYFGDIKGTYNSYSTELAPTETSKGSGVYDTGLAIGNITAGTGVVYGTFNADGNIGSIDANCIAGAFTSDSGDIGYVQDLANPSKMIAGNIIASRRNDNAIDGASFSAGNSIGNIYATITNPNGGVSGIANSTFVAGTYGSETASIGNITVNNAGIGSGIYKSVFGIDNVNGQVSNANIGNITVNCTNQAPTFGSAAIQGSVFNASTQTLQYYDTLAGALTDSSTNANGILNEVTGIYNNEGSIGDIKVNTLLDYYGIIGSTFGAGQAGSIGNINVDSGLFAIGLTSIHANQPALGYAGNGSDYSGHIGNITIKSNSTDNGQVDSNISTPLPTPGSNGGGIFGSIISASGSIGDISVNSIGYGIVSTQVTANDGQKNTASGTGSLGNINVHVTGAGASGIADGLYVPGLISSGPLGNTPGPLMDVIGAVVDRNTGLLQGVIINGPDFINLNPNLTLIPSSFSGTSIGNIDVNLSAWGGNAVAISGSQFTAIRDNNNNDAGVIGNITVNNSSSSTHAYGIEGSSFNAGAAGGIGNVLVTEAGGIAIADYNGLNLNKDTVFNSTGTLSGQSVYTSSIGTVTINENTTVEKSPLGKGPGKGIEEATFKASANIGNITSSGIGNQDIILGDNTTGSDHILAVGSLDFGSIASGKTLTVGFTDTLPGGSGSTKQVGNINTGAGNIIVSDGLSLETVGDVTVHSFLPYQNGSPLTPVAIGNGSVGSSIGLITVGVGSAANTPNYVFSFDQMNGDATGSSVIAVNFLDGTRDITTAQAASGLNNISGGIKADLL
jgi:hypothetical protein